MKTDEINKARKLFTYIKNGVVNFNHASTGPMSSRVIESLNELLHLKGEGRLTTMKNY